MGFLKKIDYIDTIKIEEKLIDKTSKNIKNACFRRRDNYKHPSIFIKISKYDERRIFQDDFDEKIKSITDNELVKIHQYLKKQLDSLSKGDTPPVFLEMFDTFMCFMKNRGLIK